LKSFFEATFFNEKMAEMPLYSMNNLLKCHFIQRISDKVATLFNEKVVKPLYFSFLRHTIKVL